MDEDTDMNKNPITNILNTMKSKKENIDELCLNNVTHSHPVRIDFPSYTARQLADVLDWLFNSGEVMTIHVSDETIKKAKEKYGVNLQKVENK